MKYVVSTSNRGIVLNLTGTWNGKDKNFIWTIKGRCDSNYATNPDDRKSVSGTQVFLKDSPIMAKSSTQKVITLLVTEAELYAATSCAQDMLFVYRLMQTMDMKIDLPMILECDNKEAINLSCNWSVGGRTCHVNVCLYMLQDLNEDKIIQMKWIKGEENSVDLGTKNLDHASHAKHTKTLCGDHDENF